MDSLEQCLWILLTHRRQWNNLQMGWFVPLWSQSPMYLVVKFWTTQSNSIQVAAEFL
jgi:hypothetical protein